MSKSIIILEDESIIALMLKKFLISLNHRVVGTAMDGKTAIELVKNAIPDLLILDVHIKGQMNGLETYQIIQKQWNIPAVFLTGNSAEVVNIQNKYPNVVILEKPVSLHELKKTIDSIFQQ
ncbi:MAG: response regulator [Bacteroidia bacterium]